jgi:hypothetical protein
MAMSFVAMVFSAIVAGRGRRQWLVFPLLLLEFLLGGAAILFWMGLVWFSAKAEMSSGISASLALVISLVVGIGVALITVVACLRLIRAGYSLVGHGNRYDVDFGNSLWFRKTGIWRPKDFTQS